MAVGMATAAVLGAGALSAGSQIGAGQQQSRAIKSQANYNAQVYEQQAELIKEKKKIRDYQFNREAAKFRGSVVASTAGKGFELGGSPLSILIDNESQLQYDKAIEDYNLSIESQFAKSSAINTRQSGAARARVARFKGYSGAFSSLLTTGITVGDRMGWGSKP